MKTISALSLLILLASSCKVHEAAPPPSVDDIIASNIEARGGRDRIRAVSSIRETATITGPAGRVAHVVREIKKPGLYRLEFSFQGTTSVFAHDGKGGWQIAPLQGQFEPAAMSPETDSAGGADQRDIEGPLVDWKQKGHNVTLAGNANVGGKDTFKLKIELRGGGIRYDYIDVASRQIVRSDVTRVIRGHSTEIEHKFSDFRPTGGLIFPHAIESQVKQRPEMLKIAIAGIELNPALDDARFQMPQ